MTDHTDCGCTEYNELSRRQFINDITGAALMATVLPEWMPKVVLAESHASDRDVVVSIFQRGGADGLSIVVPFGDPNYYTGRPTIAIPQPDSGKAYRATNLDGFFGLSEPMLPLLEAYRAKHLLLAHGVGLGYVSRSHFDAQRYMEVGKPNDPSISTGWLGRHLASTTPVRSNAPLRALGLSVGLPKTLVGAPKTLPIPDPANFSIAGSATTRTQRTQLLRDDYAVATEPIRSAALDSINTIALLNMIDFANYRPANGATYPNSSFGRALKSTAALIKADVGVEAIQVDVGGWDTHNQQNPVTPAGSMYRTMLDFSSALGAFYMDVIGGAPSYPVTLLSISEFGRNVRENGSQGTDHGRGTVAFVMGKAIAGGRVLTRNFPVLARENLELGQDLPVTIDHRDLVAEIVKSRLGNPNLSLVFPDYVPTFRGVML